MILSSQIQNHLKLYLSWFTDLFSVLVPVTSAEVLSNNLIEVNAPNHGFITGDYVFVSDGTVRNSLIDVEFTGDGESIIFTTQFNHDFVKPRGIHSDYYLSLQGFVSPALDLNGTHLIEEVQSRIKFQIPRPTSITVLPDLSTSYVIEDRPAGLKGVYQITYIDSNNFSFQVNDVPILPENLTDNMKVVKNFRIDAAVDIKRAEEMYTTQTEPYLFVILGDVNVSKSSNNKTDAKISITNQDYNLITFLQDFGLAVFIPTPNDLSGVGAQELAYGEVFNSLMSVLYAYRFKNEDTITPYKIISNGHSPAASGYNTAYYVHVYDWQQTSALNYETNLIRDIDSVAFRNIAMDMFVNEQDIEKLTFNLNLDEEQ